VNLAAFVNDDGTYDVGSIILAVQLATRVGLRQTNVTMDLDSWDAVQKRDRLLGVSLDGLMDFVDKTGISEFQLTGLLQNLSMHAKRFAREYAYDMRIPEPLLVTTIKPSGSISKLPTISSGVHRHRAPYYIRRVRISSSDPLARAAFEYGYRVYPETSTNGPTVDEFDAMSTFQRWDVLQNADTWVIEFPIASGAIKGVDDESAVEQFRRYLMLQRYWTDHNTSITITYSEDEVSDLIDTILQEWDNYIGVSFMPRDNTVYPLLPEEAITKEEYEVRANELTGSNTTLYELLVQMEYNDAASDLLDDDCATGVCPVR
jgi:ribonucleoside-triphosphate reductase